MDDQALADAARKLVRQASLSPSEVARRLEWALDEAYWEALSRAEGTEGRTTGVATPVISKADILRHVGHLKSEGYFCIENVVEPERVAALYSAVEKVRSAGWPAVFAFVYEEFWSLTAIEPLATFLEAAVGPAYLQNSAIWAHWVNGESGNAGWHPHFDMAGEDDGFLSVWIALTNATLDNGCMYLVGRRASSSARVDAIEATRDLPYESYSAILRNTIAVPAPAGSVIGWRGDILHWGSINTGNPSPRVSLALEVRSHTTVAKEFETPLFDPRSAAPPFPQRLAAIARGILKFAKFEPIMSRHRALAEQILEKTRQSK